MLPSNNCETEGTAIFRSVQHADAHLVDCIRSSTKLVVMLTDHERNDENGTDATLYRHYASRQGRWLSPDPSNGSYNLLDPQSLNCYAYLTNRPMAKTDPLGLDDDDDDDDAGDDDYPDAPTPNCDSCGDSGTPS